MLFYTEHAKDRMKQKRISKKEVEYCIEHYELALPDKKGNITYRSHTPDGRYISVVIDKRTSGQEQIITAYD